jgi:hypothetical protein
MFVFLLGIIALLVLMGALGMFSKAQVTSLKSMGVWTVGIGGLLLAVMLLLTGRGGLAISALLLLGPLLWSWIVEAKIAPPPPAQKSARMTRAEALDILGLPATASPAEIKSAHRRLMQATHPDRGGSTWLAARINQARDVLLG